jgi:hypothetical protein
VVVESRDVTFFEEGLSSPTYHKLATQAANADEPLVQQPDIAPDEPPSTTAASAPTPVVSDMRPRREDTLATSAGSDSSVDELVHDVAHVPDFPKMSLRSGRQREPGGEVYVVAFSAGLPCGVQLSQLPDPRTMREAMAAPDSDGWREVMDREMENLKSHDVHELVPPASGIRTIRLGWVLHRKFKNGTFDKNKAPSWRAGTVNDTELTTTNRSRL